MARFQSRGAYQRSASELELLPFRFTRSGDGYLASNVVGDFVRLTAAELERLVELNIDPTEDLYAKAFTNHLIAQKGRRAQHQVLAMRLRSRMAFLRNPTPLHIFVVTLRCEHSCPYCQVSRQSKDRSRFDMSPETADRALRIAFQSPSPGIKIEFQGGEPLLNFGLVERIVAQARIEAVKSGKRVEFVIASNLALLDDAVLAFCKTKDVQLSTSLDGPANLHNKNRPRPGGNSHALAVLGIRLAQERLGADRIGALMTTTEASLDQVEAIVDEYVGLKLDGIFLRPLSPYGFAIKTKAYRRYDSAKWMDFYRRGLRYILDLNRRGTPFTEFYARLVLQRMLSDRPTGYVDLRSPAGTGLGALVYNYDGRVFASDEGRMLAETGDSTFELGRVEPSTYSSLILSDKLIELVASSLAQCAPECLDCVFEPHCGADPVYHHATQRDAVGIKPLSGFCSRQKGVMGLLVDLLDNSPDDAAILRRWGGA